MERWSGKTAVVTGASAGIGAGISVALANAGLRVVGLARRPERVDALQSQVKGTGSVVSRQCDVSDSQQLQQTFSWIEQQFRTVHVLINNAGVFYGGPFTGSGDEQVSEEHIMATIDTNLKGTVVCTRHAIASMERANFPGHVVNINSIAGHYIPSSPAFNVYTCSKHAVTAFTEGLLNELADRKLHIKVTSLSPGLVKTELAGVADVKDIPALQPSDVADAVLYVLSTPPNVNITELTIMSVTEKKL